MNQKKVSLLFTTIVYVFLLEKVLANLPPQGFNIDINYYFTNKILFNITVKKGYELEISYKNTTTERDFVLFTTSNTSDTGIISDWWVDKLWWNKTQDI